MKYLNKKSISLTLVGLFTSLLIPYEISFPKIKPSIQTTTSSELEQEIESYSFPKPTEETQIILLGTDHCRPCEKAKEIFTNIKGLDFIYFKDTHEAKKMREFYNIHHYPQALVQKDSKSIVLPAVYIVLPSLITKYNINKAIKEINKN